MLRQRSCLSKILCEDDSLWRREVYINEKARGRAEEKTTINRRAEDDEPQNSVSSRAMRLAGDKS